MANIINVDYDAIPRQAASMRSKGKEINSDISSAYKALEEMHSAWYGQRYNDLIIQYNNIIPDLNNLLKLVVDQIPHALEEVANNYSLADKGVKVVTAVSEKPQEIVSINVRNDVGMSYKSAEVASYQSKVAGSFKNAVEKMNQFEGEYSKIAWQSDASDAFRAKFTELKSSIVSSIENLNSQFTTVMGKAEQEMQKTESANTIQ